MPLRSLWPDTVQQELPMRRKDQTGQRPKRSKLKEEETRFHTALFSSFRETQNLGRKEKQSHTRLFTLKEAIGESLTGL